MKKLVYAVMLLLGLSIIGSCSKEGGSTGGGSWIVGDWCITDYDDDFGGYIGEYWSFSKDGVVSYYEVDYDGNFDENATWFENGDLYGKQSVRWERQSGGEYSLKDNQLFMAGHLWGTIQKVNNDKFILVAVADFYNQGTFERIKNFKTK